MIRKPMYSLEDALDDFTQYGKLYAGRYKGCTNIRVWVRTQRPTRWLLLFKGGAVHLNLWICGDRHLLANMCTMLLGTGHAKGEARAKLELLYAYCTEDDREQRTAIAELLSDLRRQEPRPTAE